MNRLPSEPTRLVLSIAWRFFTGRGNKLLDGTARAALMGTTLGVMAMVIAMALMSGYREDLRRKLVRGNAAVIAYPFLGREMPSDPDKEAALEKLPGVTAVRRVVYGQGSVVTEAESEGLDVTFRGVDTVEDLDGLGRIDLDSHRGGAERLIRGETLEVVLGVDLARRLSVETGDSLQLMVLGLRRGRPRFGYTRAIAAGTFETGFSEFDQNWLVTDRLELEAMLGSEATSVLLEIAVDDPDRADSVSAAAIDILGGDYLVTSWRELNRELFTALKVQQAALFFVLGLIVVVSTFNVASSLVVLVRERMRDIGVLAALGLRPGQLRSVFLLYGLGLGALGSLFGIGLGALVAWVVTEFELIRFDAEMAAIYFISSVPFKIEVTDLLTILGFSLTVTLVACWSPARKAARVGPARALRYE